MQQVFRCGLIALMMSPGLVFGAVLNQTDTFQTGLNNWFAGGLGMGQTPPVPPSVMTSGGPAGAGDAFMIVTASTPTGAGSRVVAINGAQWAGNYLAAGIGSIAIDLKNLGNTALTIRLLFEDPMGAPPADEAVTNFGAVLPVGSGWMHFTFPTAPASLTALDGSATAALTNATLLRIINAPAVGDAVQQLGVLGVDNITARGPVASVPEPSTVLLALTGLAAAGLLRRKRCAYFLKQP